jgi:glycosyltransferase involved in cell wall biosynthesis
VPAEIVEDNKTGLLFTPGDAADLVRKVSWAVQHPDIMAQMGRNARIVFEDKYTRERNLRMLLDIYERLARRHPIVTM